MAGPARRLLAWAARHRSRIARTIAVVGVVVLATHLWSSAPREGAIEYAFGERHADIVEVRIAYLQDEQEQQSVRFGFPQGAPARLTHRVRLPVGTLQARVELRGRDGAVQHVQRTLVSPFDGTLRLRVDAAAR